MSRQDIPNLDLSHIAGPDHADADLHYEALGTLASQLGRSMAMHRHDQFFQVHYVLEGMVRVQLEDGLYRLRGPMVFLTPPAFLHAFVTDDDADGHVLTVRPQSLWPMPHDDTVWPASGAQIAPVCLSIGALEGEHADEARRMDQLFDLLRREHAGWRPGRDQSLLLLARLIFISLLRLSSQALGSPPPCREELQLFQQFSALMEARFREHWTLSRYAAELGIGEQRLNEVCRRMTGKPPKRLINDRLMQEARRLLLYSGQAVSQVGYALGFDDPAYFGRFFLRQADESPGSYRARMAGAPGRRAAGPGPADAG
ncbi:Transcriptional activator of 4-hydroxyphenylacetate 3-monooxygenase operon, XylS/AraC family [Castellaniella defragrans 65Phen]|uniref:Transcriptional activator of 4-hydroxyphenylacetate 3-monooxygenase operon, XylS/AraC family n=1 Tax=Castellaniella defragrans (strain DSM 12143 / CCUG 39792 / 65Phen) TaxID=1437824 RepID=W8WZU9_CASD6|nr:4-hydroxyphenylacetate catabolism regulatory protein HpaA [Castellaniella defragrans]CDM25313.1 Transcriptional activator of 4-hydroxyphenylacetate 3-monooxygenase operon, XylS/AraC family [Castellaniella defragrans 65Phen]